MKQPDVIEIGEVYLAAPSFRRRTRLVAFCKDDHVRFGLQYQHEGEPGRWLDENSFPWHSLNFDSIIRAAVLYHERIRKVLLKQKEAA
jgi:hypothetical protein